MKTKLFLASLGLAIAGCAAHGADDRFTAVVPVPGVEDGTVAYLTDFDTEAKTDSVTVTDGTARFEGVVTAPYLGRVIADGNRYSMFFVEPGTVAISDDRTPSGTPLNDALGAYSDRMREFTATYRAMPEDTPDADIEAFIDSVNAYQNEVIEQNINNPLGYYLFLQNAYDMDEPTLNEQLARYPHLKDYKRIGKVQAVFDRKRATSAGQPFTDFTIENEGKESKLSDYVGKGKPILVDFWASWCGPCRREAQVLKEIYNSYPREQLDILGVAVWDEPENTVDAIESLSLPWQQIINAQTVPTDLYGILGIPCIIMFDGDGTILFRDLQGDELKEAVANALAPKE